MCPRRSRQPQGDAPRRSPAGGHGPRRVARPVRTGIGHDSHPFGPGESAAPGRRRDRRRARACTATRTATSRSTPSPTRCSGRPVWAISAGCSRPTPRTPRGIASASSWSTEVRRRVGGAGWRPASRRPDRSSPPGRGSRLARPRCATRIAALLGLDPGAVNVKASTGNLDGAEGAGRSISALAVATRGARPVTIRLHDTLSGETRPLVPLERRHVGIYSCGPTVYGPAHIGNFRSFLFADLLVRHLRWRGLRVTWVMNITDIDDKIIRGAAAAGETIETLAERYLTAFLADADGAPDDARRTSCRGPPSTSTEIVDAHRDAARAATTPTGPTTARSSSGSRRGRPTAGWPASIPRGSGWGSGSRPTSTARTTSATSPCGRARSRASRRGRRRSGRAGRAGTSSARR